MDGMLPKPGHSQEELIEWIEAVLSLTGWTPSKLAKEAGLAASTVNRFMAGAGHLLSSSTVGRIETAASRQIRHRAALGEVRVWDDLKKRDGSLADRLVRIPEVDPRLGAAMGDSPSEWGFPENWFRFTYGTDPANCRVVAIEDDAMFSDLRAGDRVVVDLTRTYPSPSGVFLLDDGVTWTPRHLELMHGSEPPTVMITARNPDYRNREALLSGLKIVGRVMGMWRRI